METFIPATIPELQQLILKNIEGRTSLKSNIVLRPGSSSVLFLLGKDSLGDPALILTKRSRLVSQPGDLCSPGGRIAARIDPLLARFFSLPGGPLHRLPGREGSYDPQHNLLAATALRESWEEIRLNPFSVTLMGTLPPHELLLFNKTIFPVCGWSSRTAALKANAEVEKILFLPLTMLLDAGNYAAYDLLAPSDESGKNNQIIRQTICFRHRDKEGEEILWGATLAITLTFLNRIFGFTPPARNSLPRVQVRLLREYYRK